MKPRLTSNSVATDDLELLILCLYLPSSRIIDVHNHAVLCNTVDLTQSLVNMRQANYQLSPVLVFENWSHTTAKTGLELKSILLPQPLEFSNHRHEPPCLVSSSLLKK